MKEFHKRTKFLEHFVLNLKKDVVVALRTKVALWFPNTRSLGP